MIINENYIRYNTYAMTFTIIDEKLKRYDDLLNPKISATVNMTLKIDGIL
jgi:hypothetical protein